MKKMEESSSKLILENYAGVNYSTTPTVVQEILASLSEFDREKVSVRFENENASGWMWLIQDGTVYIWNFKEKLMNCYELPLPSSGLVHSTRLCHVLIHHHSSRRHQDIELLIRPPSCLYASPEGCVRYWPKISQPSVYVDQLVELAGQVGHALTPIKGKQPAALVLSTTTCGLFLLTAPESGSISSSSRGDAPIRCVQLKVSQNLISGICRRVSSLIFPAGFSSQDVIVNAATCTKKGSPDNLLYVMSSKFQLQCWHLDQSPSNVANNNNKFLWAMDLRQITTEKLAYEIWHLNPANVQLRPQQIKIWPLDFYLTSRRRMAILTAIFDPNSSSNVVHYAIVYYVERGEEGAAECVQILRLPITRNYEPQLEEPGRDRMTLLCPFSYDGFFAHTDSYVATFDEDEKKVHGASLAEEDFIFGSGIHGDQVLLFTLQAGLQLSRIRRPSDNVIGLPYLPDLANQRFPLHYQTKGDEELQDMARDRDRTRKLKAAFLYFLNHNLSECESILEDILLIGGGRKGEDWLLLDDAVLAVARDIVDDLPASDPRWLREFVVDQQQQDQTEGGTSRRKAAKLAKRTATGGSVLLTYQLDDKRKTMELFLAFLKSMKLKEKLGDVKSMVELCQLGEKLDACAAFVRKAEGEGRANADLMGKICNRSMKSVLDGRQETTGDSLSVRDVFYRKVSEFDQLLPVLVDEALQSLDEQQQQQEEQEQDEEQEEDTNFKLDLILRVGECLLAVLTAARKYRSSFDHVIGGDVIAAALGSGETWLNDDHVRSALIAYCVRTADLLGGQSAGMMDPPAAGLLTRQCRDIADMIMAECTIIPVGPDWTPRDAEEMARRLIQPLVSAERFEPALYLAEKYRQFELLIEICEHLADDRLLDGYKRKYEQDGFVELFYDYCISKGKPGHIFHQQGRGGEAAELAQRTSRYLESRRRPDLKWIFHLKTDQFEKAGMELLNLANNEQKSLDDKMTYLSLAKLAALASDHPDQSSACLKHAEEGLVLAEHQKRMPSAVAEGRPLNAEEVIQAYISDPSADEWSIAKAIDLMWSVCANKMPRDDYNALRSHIWAEALLKDDWKSILANNSEDLLSAASDTVFSRTIQLLCNLCKDDRSKMMDYLSSSDELLLGRVEIAELAEEDPKFEFVLRAGEEKVADWIKGGGDDGHNEMMETSYYQMPPEGTAAAAAALDANA